MINISVIDYSIRPNDLYHRRMPPSAYDVINADGHYPYEKRYSRHNPNQYSSMQRRRHRTRVHDQGSSPIRMKKKRILIEFLIDFII